MKEEYKECPNCHNMADKSDKECPYCLYSFWSTDSTPQNNIKNTEKWWTPTFLLLEIWDLIDLIRQKWGEWGTWRKAPEKKEIIKRLRTFLIIFIIITWLIPTLIGIFSSIFWK